MSNLLEEMKLLNEDHTPDGYPAIKMSEINELVEIIEKQSLQLAKANERVADLEQEKNKYFESLCMHAQRIPESDWGHNKDAVALLNKFAIEKKIEGVNWFSEKYCDDEHSFLADKAIEQLRKEQE